MGSDFFKRPTRTEIKENYDAYEDNQKKTIQAEKILKQKTASKESILKSSTNQVTDRTSDFNLGFEPLYANSNEKFSNNHITTEIAPQLNHDKPNTIIDNKTTDFTQKNTFVKSKIKLLAQPPKQHSKSMADALSTFLSPRIKDLPPANIEDRGGKTARQHHEAVADVDTPLGKDNEVRRSKIEYGPAEFSGGVVGSTRRNEEMVFSCVVTQPCFESREVLNKGVGQESRQNYLITNFESKLSALDAKDPKKKGDVPECVVCCSKKADAVCMPCGHGGICEDCVVKIVSKNKECYLCKEAVEVILKIDPLRSIGNMVVVLGKISLELVLDIK